MRLMTIDTGTTNTRVKVWYQERVIASSLVEIGVRDTAITGSKHKLQQGVREALERARVQANMTWSDIKLILASGMITSNVGLYEIPHVFAPAGIGELAQAMLAVTIPEVCEKPIWFIPGVKNNITQVDLANCEAMDIMRGEEVETFGLIHQLGLKGPAVFVLPGSHTKFIKIDGQNRIVASTTTLAGELLGVITNNTILANALGNSFPEKLEDVFLLEGASYAERLGLNRVCFMVRLLDQFASYSRNEKANFLLGAVIGTDLLSLKYSKALKIEQDMPVVIAGKKILKEVFALLIKKDPYFSGEVIVAEDHILNDIAGFGALVVARYRGLAT